MKLTEAFKIMLEFDDKEELGMFDPAEDKIERRTMDDSRKPKLTLRHLNRLKKIRATRKLDLLKKESLLGLMYGKPAGEEEGGGSPF